MEKTNKEQDEEIKIIANYQNQTSQKHNCFEDSCDQKTSASQKKKKKKQLDEKYSSGYEKLVHSRVKMKMKIMSKIWQ